MTAFVIADAASCGIRGDGVGGFLSGTQTAQTVTLTSGDVTLTLNPATDGNSFQATYSLSGNCVDRGTAAGVRVPSLTGSWSGTTGSTTLTASFTQASPVASTIKGQSYLALTGTLQFTSSTCSASGSLGFPSFVEGTFVVLEASLGDHTDLSASGLISDPATAKEITLGYATTTGSGPCQGEIGRLTITR